MWAILPFITCLLAFLCIRLWRRSPSQKSSKGTARLEWWQRLQALKPELRLPKAPAAPEGCGVPRAWQAVEKMVKERSESGRDWLVRDSDYGDVPAHSAVKKRVNGALLAAIQRVFGESLCEQLMSDSRKVLLILDTPQYGTLGELVAGYPGLQCCQQVIIPQADLRHYFEMLREGGFYPGVRAQRLDHWLCANAQRGFRCQAAFLDYECRLAGARSARLCPAADIMRYFRFGYPGDVSVLCITVGLEEPASTPEEVDAFVRWEALLSGYEAELQETWKYRMVSLLYVVRKRGGK